LHFQLFDCLNEALREEKTKEGNRNFELEMRSNRLREGGRKRRKKIQIQTERRCWEAQDVFVRWLHMKTEGQIAQPSSCCSQCSGGFVAEWFGGEKEDNEGLFIRCLCRFWLPLCWASRVPQRLSRTGPARPERTPTNGKGSRTLKEENRKSRCCLGLLGRRRAGQPASSDKRAVQSCKSKSSFLAACSSFTRCLPPSDMTFLCSRYTHSHPRN
jgi:hypothetical protein